MRVPRFAQAAVLLALAVVSPATPVASAAEPVTLTVFAASSLTDSFKALAKAYETHHADTRVMLSVAGSQQLAQQLVQGAPADVFAPAHTEPMALAVQHRRVASGQSQPFAQNRLVIITRRIQQPPVRQLADLAKPRLKLVLGAPAVPVGRYSLDVLTKASKDPAFAPAFKLQVMANVVSQELDVRAILTKVALGAADAGIVYQSDLASPMGERVTAVPIPAALNVTATYPIAVLADAPHPREAQAFVSYVLSPDGQRLLATFGFVPVRAMAPAARPSR